MMATKRPAAQIRNRTHTAAAWLAALLALAPCAAPAAPITKAATGIDLTDGASWTGGNAPGPGDIATWAGTSLGAGLTLGASKSWNGISVTNAASTIGVTGAGTLTLGANGINMGGSTVNLSLGNPLTLGANQSWTVNSGRTLTITGGIGGAAMVLTKSGSGTLTLTSPSGYSGGTFINGGLVTIDPLIQGALGTGTLTIDGGASLRLSRQQIANAVVIGAGGGTITGGNSFADNLAGPVTLNGLLTVDAMGTGSHEIGGDITGPGGITKISTPRTNGTGMVLKGTNSYTGPTIIMAGPAKCTQAAALGAGALDIRDGATLELAFTGTRNIASLKLGGIPQPSGTHGSTASPATNKNDSYFVGTGTVTVAPNSAKDILTCSFGALGEALVGTDTVNLIVPSGTDRTALSPTFTLSPRANCSPASGTTRNFTSTKIYTVTAQDGSTKAYSVTVTDTVQPAPELFTWKSAISGNWSDASKWTNEAVPTIVTAPQADGQASYTLDFNVTGTYAATHNLNAGFLVNRLNFGGTVTLDGTSSLALINNGATLPQINQNSGSGVTIKTPLTLAANVTLGGSGAGNMTLSGAISGTASLTKTNSGILTLSGNNSYTGTLSLQGGSVSVGSLNRVSGGTAASNLGAPTDAASGTISLGTTTTAATLVYTGPGETTDRVIKLAGTTGGAVLSQNGTPVGLATTRGTSGLLKFTSDILIPGSGAGDNRKTLTLTQTPSLLTGPSPGGGEISGSIGDSLTGNAGQRATSITKAGPGKWTLSGPNTYSGATKVQAGILALTRPDALGTGTLDISTGTRVQLDFIGTRQIAALTFNAGSTLPNGTYGSSASIATNNDDTRFSGPGTLTVGPIGSPTTTTLARTAGTEPANGGADVTITATVAGAAPTGSVSFFNGLTLIGSAALDDSYQASLTTTALGGGSHALTARYAGNAGNAPSSSATLVQTVVETRAATTTTLTTSGNPSNHGAAVTFTAAVSGGATGKVTFHNGNAVLATVPLNGAAQATLTTTSLAVGWNAVTARYQGDAAHAPSASTPPLFQIVNPPAGNGKLKVYILAGQSNMVGKGRVEVGRNPADPSVTRFPGGLGSLRNMLNRNPEKYNYLADPANPVGGNPGWLKRNDVWVVYWNGVGVNDVPSPPTPMRLGDLDKDFGDDGGEDIIGPEYGFGLQVGSQLGDQVLLIKYAFGGKSLAVDFRPPGAVAARGGVVGPYYTGMLSRVNEVLGNLSTYFPAYTGGGYEIAGFGWHQGWNDRSNPAYTAEYEANLTNLIHDLRTDLAVPSLPVVVGNTGMSNANFYTNGLALVTAQNNVGDPAKHPEFTGTVTTVDTRPFDYGELLGAANNQAYHWNFNAESYFNIGESMGKAMMALRPATLSSARDILNFEFPGLPAVSFSGTHISVAAPWGTDVSALAPIHAVSPLATCAPASGSVRNFTTPQTYTVTAQDGSTQAYTVTVVPGPSPFNTWVADPAQGLTAGVNDGPSDDPDHDGIVNLLEFVLGGAPMLAGQEILPQLRDSPGGVRTFEYDRSKLSPPPATTQVVEYGSDLTGWTPVTIPATSSGIVEIIPGSPNDRVKVALPNFETHLFVRLKVTP